MAAPIMVHMHAYAATESDPNTSEARTFRVAMDPDLIRNAASPEEAVAAFREVAKEIVNVAGLEYFDILKVRYDREYFRTRKARKI